MRKNLWENARRILEEEEGVPFDEEYLRRLDNHAAYGEKVVEDLLPGERKALYEFIWKAESMFLGEVLANRLSSRTLLEAFFMLAFEVGVRVGKETGEL